MPLHVSSTCAHRQEVKIVLYSIWYHHTETSEWSKITKITKITKIQFYKYEHMEVKFMNEFFWCDYCILLTVIMLCHVEVMFIRLLNLLKMYDVYLHYLSKKVAFIQLLILFGVHLLYVNCRIYRKCNLTVVKTYLTCRWPSRAQVESGLVGMHGIVD